MRLSLDPANIGVLKVVYAYVLPSRLKLMKITTIITIVNERILNLKSLINYI